MNLRELAKALIVPYSIWLPIANIPRVLRDDPKGRMFAAGVAALRGFYLPPVISELHMEKMCAFMGCSEYEATSIVIPHIDRSKYDTIGGGTGVERLIKMALLMKLHRCTTGFEIGTFVGVGSVWIASNLEEGGHLYTLDLPPDETARIGRFRFQSDRRVADFRGRDHRAFHSHPLQTMITEYFGDSKSFDFSKLDTKIDFFYIDGDHSLEAIAKDTLNALNVLSEDGFIVWDDYLPYHMVSHPDVVRFINWFHAAVDPVYDIGEQAAWFARKSRMLPCQIRDKCEAAIRLKWPRLI